MQIYFNASVLHILYITSRISHATDLQILSGNQCEFHFQLPKITPANILDIVNEFENKKSSDYDGNSPFLLKNIIHSILDPLCYIFNKSLDDQSKVDCNKAFFLF